MNLYKFDCCVCDCERAVLIVNKSLESAIFKSCNLGWKTTSLRPTSKHLCPIHSKKFKIYQKGMPFKGII